MEVKPSTIRELRGERFEIDVRDLDLQIELSDVLTQLSAASDDTPPLRYNLLVTYEAHNSFGVPLRNVAACKYARWTDYQTSFELITAGSTSRQCLD